MDPVHAHVNSDDSSSPTNIKTIKIYNRQKIILDFPSCLSVPETNKDAFETNRCEKNPRSPSDQNNNTEQSPSASGCKDKRTSKCQFCVRNGECREFYQNHSLRDKMGNVSCPILRRFICQTCNATGDNAHTLTYCPKMKALNNGRTLISTAIALKTSRIKSNGKARY